MIIDNWKLCLVRNKDVKSGFDAATVAAIEKSGKTIIPAAVPGNFELDMAEAGLIDYDYYFGENTLRLQEFEDMHLWYFARFTVEDKPGFDKFIRFGGIDTASLIYIDGKLIGKTENMLIPHEFSINDLSAGEHEVVVHIIPTVIYCRNKTAPLACHSLQYNMDQLMIRKAPYMFGWDIMPRIVSGGLWKEVSVEYKPVSRIEEEYIYTRVLSEDKARISSVIRITASEDILQDYTYRISGSCRDSSFSAERKIFSSVSVLEFDIEKPYLWFPKNYGEQNLYDITFQLLYKGEVVDSKKIRFGVRIVELRRSSVAGDDGDFVFIVNDRKIYAMGTNWVPTDAFPSRHRLYRERGLKMVDDIGCNFLRLWGGNVYEDDALFDFCDEKGIMVWQDFSFACGKYPVDDNLYSEIKTEAQAVVRRLRNHACLALWCGDNENDSCAIDPISVYGRETNRYDPDSNKMTRELLKNVIRDNDCARPYLPSSPYIDAKAFMLGNPAEEHLWGPRDFFKGEYYGTSVCHFASETGYHGCNSPASLKKFLTDPTLQKFGDCKICTDGELLVHAAGMEIKTTAPYAYRIPLMTSQVDRIFTPMPDTLEDYALASQISEAEADKYFIERFRIGKWRRTGMIWWNIIDGWPQISDAVVDWYGVKKIAYHFIKRSQNPVCLMYDEPENGKQALFGVNDTCSDKTVDYTVYDSKDRVILKGTATVPAHSSVLIAEGKALESDFYYISWNGGVNTYISNIGDKISLSAYKEFLKKHDLLETEGF